MMILVKQGNIIAEAHEILFGLFDDTFEKWQLTDENGDLICYFVDDEYTTVKDVELPSDYVSGKYFYENGEFVLNENWKPYRSPEQILAEIEEKLQNGNTGGTVDSGAFWDEMASAIEKGVNEV